MGSPVLCDRREPILERGLFLVQPDPHPDDPWFRWDFRLGEDNDDDSNTPTGEA